MGLLLLELGNKEAKLTKLISAKSHLSTPSLFFLIYSQLTQL